MCGWNTNIEAKAFEEKLLLFEDRLPRWILDDDGKSQILSQEQVRVSLATAPVTVVVWRSPHKQCRIIVINYKSHSKRIKLKIKFHSGLEDKRGFHYGMKGD